jgi:hypothetical protein
VAAPAAARSKVGSTSSPGGKARKARIVDELASGARRELVQGREEAVDVDRLGPVVVEPGATCALDVVGQGVGRQCDHARAGQRGLGAQAAQHLGAVDVRQLQVEQHGPRARGDRAFDARPAVLGRVQADAGPQRDQLLHEHQIDRVVLDAQQVECGRRDDGCGTGRPLRRGHVDRTRPPDPKLAAGAGRAVDLDLPAHAVDQRAHHAQADAAARDAAALRAQAVEGLEQMRQLLGRHAVAAVAHAQPGPGGLVDLRQFDPAAAVVVLQRIRQQVAEHLAHAPGVGPHRGVHRADAQRDAGPGGLGCQPVDRLGEQRGQRHRLAHEVQGAGFDRAQVEHVLDQRQQVLRRVDDAFATLALPRRQRSRLVAQHQLGETEHRVQRRAQLVAHARQEHGLGLARGFGGQPGAPLLVGTAALGDVQGDADQRHRAALCVALGHAPRQQRAIAAVRSAVARLGVDDGVGLERTLRGVGNRLTVVRVDAVAHLRQRHAARLRRVPDQRVAPVVEVDALGGEVDAPERNADQPDGQRQLQRGRVGRLAGGEAHIDSDSIAR